MGLKMPMSIAWQLSCELGVPLDQLVLEDNEKFLEVPEGWVLMELEFVLTWNQMYLLDQLPWTRKQDGTQRSHG